MTSSLVGSEMCIRDSPPSVAARTPKCCSSCRRSASKLSRRAGGHSCKPVSYTHLTLPTICSV
eukprot:1043387-Prorocentrum_lima.AAC.1